MLDKITNYIVSLKVSNKGIENFNNLVKLCELLNDCEIDDEFSFCRKILDSNSNVCKIVKSVVDENFDVITHGNISSLNSNDFFVFFLEIYCMDNAISIEVNEFKLDESNINTNSYYYRFIGGYPVLSREEEIRLFKMYESATGSDKKSIRDRIVNCNLRLVVTIASKYNFKLPFDDLVQEGNLGLVEAIESFDYKRGCKFSTYAVIYIKKNLIRAIKSQSNNIRITYSMHDKIKAYKKFIVDYQNKNGVIPSRDEIMISSGLSIEDINLIERNLNDTVSLDELVFSDDPDTDMYNFISDDNSFIEDDYDKKELMDTFYKVFKDLNLSNREISIMVLYYGLGGNYEHTYDYIGKKYGITRERVRQILFKAKAKIRNNKKCLKMLAEYMPSSEESFQKAYLKRRGLDE